MVEAILPNLSNYYWEYSGPTGYKKLMKHYGRDIAGFDHAVSAMNSFPYYCEQVQGFKMPPHSYEMVDTIMDYDRVVAKAARGHVKSTTLQLFASWASLFPQNFIYRFGTDPRKDFAILQVSFGADQSVEWQSFYQQFVEDGIESLHIPLKVTDQSASRLKLSNRVQCKSAGMTSPLRGGHPHILLGDDLLSDKRYISQDLLKKIYFQGLVGMAMPGGKIAVVGTPLSYNDLLAELSNLPESENARKYSKLGHPISARGYVYLKYRAIHETTGRALWPEMRPLSWLEQQRLEQGAIMFAREYLCEPLSDAGAVFDYDLLSVCDRPNEKYRITKGGALYGGADLARSEDPNASQTVYILLEELMKNVLIVRDLWVNRVKSSKKKVEQLYYWNDRYDFKHFNVENNAYQDEFVELLEDSTWRAEISERWLDSGMISKPLAKMKVKGDTTTSKKHTEQHGIPSMVPWFEKEQILFPMSDQRSWNVGYTKASGIEVTNMIKSELATWIYNPEKDKYECLAPQSDISMALYIALKGYRSAKKRALRFAAVSY